MTSSPDNFMRDVGGREDVLREFVLVHPEDGSERKHNVIVGVGTTLSCGHRYELHGGGELPKSVRCGVCELEAEQAATA